MKKVQKILPSALDDELTLLGLAGAAFERWEEVVGTTLAARSHPDRYDRGTVWVAVAGSAWAQELRLMKPKILARLCEISKQPGLFKDLRFGVRPLPTREPVETSVLRETSPSLPEKPSQNASEPLSIRDIAARRLKNWPNVDSN